MSIGYGQTEPSNLEELSVMQKSGLNMWQLLQSSTIKEARAVGKETEFGSIERGKSAVMVLLARNPLERLDNWTFVEWVILKGIAWRPDAVLNVQAN